MRPPRLSLNESLWVCGGARAQEILYPRVEIAALRERGAKVFLLNGATDAKGLEELGRLARQSDVHIVLMWLRPREMMSLYPILRERKNFSVVLDDWWIYPACFTREADYIINRMYSGIAAWTGLSKFTPEPPPLFAKPEPVSNYSVMSAALRLPALTVSPLMDAYNFFQRRRAQIRPERLLHLPFSVSPESLPLKSEPVKFDFTLTGSTYGVWLMRDPYAPFRHTFANLYYDRKRLMDLIMQFDGKPFRTFDWRKSDKSFPPVSWEDYCRVTRESRYVVATGGFHNSALPKHLEYACLGTPMIGRKLPFEYPWLDECLVDVDIMRMTPEKIRPLLDEAMARYPALRENCLKWRERLFKLHDPHTLFDMLQAQADGRPIPAGYLKPEVNRRHPVPGN
jgi:hypothetical protein